MDCATLPVEPGEAAILLESPAQAYVAALELQSHGHSLTARPKGTVQCPQCRRELLAVLCVLTCTHPKRM